jgi:A/G-specific adenine glycosylase
VDASALLARADDFRAALRAWFERERRPLPWRLRPSVYGTVVSEFMLQQTQVATALPYYSRWMAVLPDWNSLAAASEEQVLKLWEGLGYYSRASNLHRLGRAVAALPAPPRTVAEWQSLPGVGPYTAAAIASIACGQPEACVDGNVVRILARLTACEDRFRDGTAAVKAFTPVANALLEVAHPGRHNESMMELGALVCRKIPACSICPVAQFCAGAAQGIAGELPRLAAKTIEKQVVDRLWIQQSGRLLLHRAPAGSKRMSELHEIPTLQQAGLASPDGLQLIATKQRSITRYRITERFYRWSDGQPGSIVGEGSPDLRWVSADELDRIALSGPHRRWTRELLESFPG